MFGISFFKLLALAGTAAAVWYLFKMLAGTKQPSAGPSADRGRAAGAAQRNPRIEAEDMVACSVCGLHDHQNTAAETLWGAWLLPLAILVYRSRFLPRFLGVWIAVAGFAYVILSFTGVLLPQYQDKVFTISQPAFLGEVAFMLWLVIKGAKPQSLHAAASSSGAD